MYLKLADDTIYTPIHLCPLTMENLIKTMTTKFAPLKDLQVKVWCHLFSAYNFCSIFYELC